MEIIQDNNMRQTVKYINRNGWHEYAKSYKSLISTGRRPIPLKKYPKDLDFSKTIGNTTYVVKSHFNKSSNECALGIIMRWIENGTNI